MTESGAGTSHVGAKPVAVTITTLDGQKVQLLRADEKKFYETARAKYQAEYTFTLTNDLRSLDRLLLLEVQMRRYQWFIMAGQDYTGTVLDLKEEQDIHKRMKEIEPLITQIQSDLGLTKTKREQSKHDSVGGYIQQLQIAAKEHGINREKQLGKAIELTKELFSMAGAWKRSNAEERRKLGFDGPEDIVDWILEYMKPEFDSVDAYFRKNQARFYRRSL